MIHRWFIACVVLLGLAMLSWGQATTQPSSQPATSPASQPATAPTTGPTTRPERPPPERFIPLSDVPRRADDAAAFLSKHRTEIKADPSLKRQAARADSLLVAVEKELADSRATTASNSSIRTINELDELLQRRSDELTDVKENLATRAIRQDLLAKELRENNEAWWPGTIQYAEAIGAPDDVLQRAKATLAAVVELRKAAESSRDLAVTKQNLVGQAQEKISEVQGVLNTARDEVAGRMFMQDSPPIWIALMRRGANQAAIDTRQTFEAQWSAAARYISVHQTSLFVQFFIWLMIVPVILAARKHVRLWVAEDQGLRRAAAVFESPIAVAALVALFFSEWIYPEAPRLIRALLGGLALIPTILLLRKLLEPRLFPIFYALVFFYTCDLLRGVAGAHPLVGRLILTAELGLGAVFVIWLLQSGRLKHATEANTDTLGRIIMLAVRLIGVAFIAALMAALLGFVSLASALGDGSLGGAYVAVILYAVMRIADGLTMAALRVRPLSLLRIVRLQRTTIWRTTRRILQWTATVLWIYITLTLFGIHSFALSWLQAVWNAGFEFGAISLSVGSVVSFGLTIWASSLISRFIRFVLEEDVYPRFQLGRGLPYAISTTLHYAIVVFGFVLAVAGLGYDLTKFTILASAFGVGLGFGLQNIFNNFVSGLILLFERPIKVGDVVQIGSDVGVVRRIGIRASVVRTGNGAEVILPNGKLIADPVTNWTPGTRGGRGIDLQIAVSGAADPRVVMTTWVKVAAAHAKITEDPQPRAALVSLGGDLLRFEMNAWTDEFESWVQTRSELAMALHAALTEAGIVLK